MNDEIHDSRSRPEEESEVAHLLRLAGARPVPSADREQRVRRAVMQQWRRAVTARRRRRLVAIGTLTAVAASTVLVVRSGWIGDVAAPSRVPFGAIERVEGTGTAIAGPGTSDGVAVAPGAAISTGDELFTGDAGRLGIRARGLSIRLDRRTRVRVASTSAVTLVEGALYVDSGPGAAALAIDTRLGTVRHIGTQFEVRLDDDALRVRVRTGLVEVEHGAQVHTARPATELTVGPAGAATTRAISGFGPEWEWATGVAPVFGVEGRSLGAFLDHLCREQGWTLGWSDRQLATDASGIILHGAFEGLTPIDQVRVALSASGLGYRLDNGELSVFRPAP